jgi:hypothetical protein
MMISLAKVIDDSMQREATINDEKNVFKQFIRNSFRANLLQLYFIKIRSSAQTNSVFL